MSGRTEFAERMKRYEEVSDAKLMRRTPVIIRIDGKAFHTFTKHLKKPFDKIFVNAMANTMKYLCENIQGCVFGYTQSDEISLLLIDYQTLETDCWFEYRIQKMASVAASMATFAFNRNFEKFTILHQEESDLPPAENMPYLSALQQCIENGAMFDARCFNMPKEEVTNYFYYRQQDAVRNSIQALGQSKFSQRELQGKSCDDIQHMLQKNYGMNINTVPLVQRHGACCYRVVSAETGANRFIINWNIPTFKGEDRKFIDKHFSF